MMNIDISKKVNTASVSATTPSNSKTKENDGMFAAELKSLEESKTKETKEPAKTSAEQTNAANKTGKTDVKPEQKTKMEAKVNKTSEKQEKTVEKPQEQKTEKTENVKNSENNIKSGQPEEPKTNELAETQKNPFLQKEDLINTNEFEVGEIKQVGEVAEPVVEENFTEEYEIKPAKDLKEVIEQLEINPEKEIIKQEKEVVKQEIVKPEQVIPKEKEATKVEIKPEVQISITKPDFEPEIEETAKPEKTTKHEKPQHQNAEIKTDKKEENDFKNIIEETTPKDDIDKPKTTTPTVAKEAEPIEIDENIIKTTKFINGLEDTVKEIKKINKENTPVEKSLKPEEKSVIEPKTETQKFDKKLQIKEEKTPVEKVEIKQDIPTEKIEKKPQIKEEKTPVEKIEIKQEIPAEKFEKKPQVKEEKTPVEKIEIKQEIPTEKIEKKPQVKEEKTEIKVEKKKKTDKSEDEKLIDNNMNIQDASEKNIPQMNANMNFNSNEQPFSEFVTPKKEELKATKKDLAEEQAILSTMDENIAIANRNMLNIKPEEKTAPQPKETVVKSAPKATKPVETILQTVLQDEPEEVQEVQSKTKTVTTEEGIKKVDRKTNVVVETVVKYDTVVMDKADVDFFSKLVNEGTVDMSTVQHAEKSSHVSKTLADLLAKAMQDNKPVRIDFDNDISVIIKIGKDGKISADFLPSSQVAEAYLKENLPLLKQKLDDNNIEYDELNQRKQKQDNQENRKKGRKDE